MLSRFFVYGLREKFAGRIVCIIQGAKVMSTIIPLSHLLSDNDFFKIESYFEGDAFTPEKFHTHEFIEIVYVFNRNCGGW